MQGSIGVNDHEDLSAFAQFKREAGQYKIPNYSEQRRLGLDIFAGKLGLVGLDVLVESGRLTEEQQVKINALRATPFVKSFSDQFRLQMDSEARGEKERSSVQVFKEYKEALRGEMESIDRYSDFVPVSSIVGSLLNRSISMLQDARISHAKLVESNLRLAISIAGKYAGVRGMSMGQLISYGNERLMIAAAKYDFRTGNKFGTLATWWIRQGISKGIRDEGQPVHVPDNTGRKADMLGEKYIQELQITGESRILENAKLEVRAAWRANQIVVSLDKPVGFNDHPRSIGDNLAAIEGEEANVEDSVVLRMVRQGVRRVVDLLPDKKQRRVLVLRFGLEDGRERTLDEVGKELGGITREGVRGIQNKAFETLETLREVKILKGLLEI